MTPGPAAGPRPNPPEALSDVHDLTQFDCGNADLDRWLRQRARTSEGATARTFVVAAGGHVVAYYCLAAGSVVPRELPRKIRHNNPEQVPVIVIGRLAVDRAFQGRGFGKGLLKDAILRALQAAQSIGVRAIVVHAIDDRAAAFYKKFGFLPSPLDARTFILPVATAAAALG